MELVITRTCQIDSLSVLENDQTLLANNQQTFDDYMKACYKMLKLAYPKFYKMDRLSKLGFVGTEVLLKGHKQFLTYDRDKIAVILENYHSSIDVDQKHQKSISDKDQYFPSPSIFVYTLPNIMVGEICIRHNITGEGSCFLFPENGSDFINKYITSLFEQEDYQCCIAGKVDYYDEKYVARLYLIEKKELVEKHMLKFDSIF